MQTIADSIGRAAHNFKSMSTNILLLGRICYFLVSCRLDTLLYLAPSLSLSRSLFLSPPGYWLHLFNQIPGRKNHFWHWSFGLVPLTRHHVTPLWSAYCTTYVCLYRHNHTHTYKILYYMVELWWIMMVIFIILNFRHTQKDNLYIDIS